MRHLRKTIALALAVSLSLLNVPLNVRSARADDDQIFTSNIKPNIMLFIDTSGSMDWLIPNGGTGAAYDKNKQYPQPASGSQYYKYCQQGNNKVQCDNTLGDSADVYNLFGVRQYDAITKAPSAAQDSLRNYGRYDTQTLHLRTGNYFNYMLSEQAAKKKIDIAKDIVKRLIDGFDGIRLGLAMYQHNDKNFGDEFNDGPDPEAPGAKIVSEIIDIDNSGNKQSLKSQVDQITAVGSTPMGAALRDLGQYFAGTLKKPGAGTYASPVESSIASCQPNYIIFMSDGLPNDGLYSWNNPSPGEDPNDGNGNLTGTPVVGPWVATALKSQNPPATHVLIHTIGFAIASDDITVANATLTSIATNGGGKFYSAGNEVELEQAIEDAILRIFAAVFTFASPVVPTTSATGSNRAYLASFQSDPSRPFWRGYLKAYKRGSDGTVKVNPTTGVPLDVDPVTGAPLLVWEAGDMLTKKAASSRTIYTMVGGSRVEFKTSTSSITTAILGVSGADRDKVIDYIRGIDTLDEDRDSNVTEEREWKLGDIFHSSPVLVTPPIAPSSDTSYITFRDANKYRTTILLANANDGMLHAFKESDGDELWGFIPHDLLGGLKTLATRSAEHPFYADSSPIVADVKISTPSDSTVKWRTIAVFGERRGGRNYHALDITDTTNPQYLWSFTDSKLGETWSEPSIGKVKMADGTTKYVAFVGGGYDTAYNNQTGKAVFAIDLATGTKLWEYYNSTSSDDRQYLNYSIPANATIADLNLDGYVDRLYIGDVGGQLWKFDLSAAATLSGGLVNNWTGKRLFKADVNLPTTPPDGEFYPDQAIYAAPIPAYDEQKNLWVYFGTGDRNHPNAETAPNRFYAIKDNVDMTNDKTLKESDLADVTSGNKTVTQGWYFKLGSDEKVLASADVFNKVAFFSTFTPTSAPSCTSGGGTANLYAVQITTGYAAMDFSTGVALATTDASKTRSKTIGSGIPSKPVIVLTESGATISTSVIAATTSQQLPSNPAPPPSAMRHVLYWRDMF